MNDSEISKLNEQELIAAIRSEWKKVRQMTKKQIGPLLYSLVRLVGDHDTFGDWVEANLSISRRTIRVWAEEWRSQEGRDNRD